MHKPKTMTCFPLKVTLIVKKYEIILRIFKDNDLFGDCYVIVMWCLVHPFSGDLEEGGGCS